MDRRGFLKAAAISAAGLAMTDIKASKAAQTLKQQPSILLLIGDDMSWFDCQPYGNKVVKTPHMQKLADEGLCLDAMFTATAMCAPTRQQLYTGMFPVRNGGYPNHSRVYKGVKSLPHHLTALGYRVGLIGKKHYKPADSFPFEYFGGRGHDGGRGQDINVTDVAGFMNRSEDQPYCLVVASNQPHTPWTRKHADVSYKPEDITVPPHLVDCPETRQGLARYYHEISYLDATLKQCLELVEKTGRADNTLVMFTSEQGDGGFPFGGKWTCYDTGLKTAFILRWPKVIKPGTRSDAMVQYVDVVPTLIEAAGGNPETIDTGRPDANGNTGFDGRSFLDVVMGKTDAGRDYVYGVQTTRGINSGSACYPIRSVRSKRYKYIWNPNHQATFHNVASKNNFMKAWRQEAKTNQAVAERVKFYQHRPEEELYDLHNDPWELKNLADEPSLANVKESLKRELKAWMAQQGDEGIATEMRATDRQGTQGNPGWKSYEETLKKIGSGNQG